MTVPFEFDYKNPDYLKVWEWRIRVLTTIRENPGTLEAFIVYYKDKPWDFISHWGSTFDPRQADVGLPTIIPFVLNDKQVDWAKWLMDRWHSRENGLVEKSRDVGMSWLSLSTACTLCLFHNDISIGFGSRKEEYVDKIGDPKSLFWKARMFMSKLPADFRGSWNLKTHAPHMRILFPDSGSTITGESGDGIGRGDRKSIYFVDEAAYIERPELVEASLSATTNCRIDISSVHGMANPFAQKRHGGKIKVFTFHWRDDPRKDDSNIVWLLDGKKVSWYEKQKNDLDAVTLAQEVDINYSASVEGVVIPSEWVQAAVDACKKLGIEPTGHIDGALDVADQGVDLNAMAFKKGVHLFHMESWSGKGSDTFYTTERAFRVADDAGCDKFKYDADGIGAFVRGDSRVINERRIAAKQSPKDVKAFRGSGEVAQPEREMVKGRKNKDYFMNFKAQSWWSLRMRFQTTFRAVNGATDYDKDNIISIDKNLPELSKLLVELPQATYTISTTGKILIDKAPDNARSPNHADSVMELYSPPSRSGGLFT